MAVSYSNTDGAIGITDGGTPRTMTIKAREDITGGFWVNGSTAEGVVGSGAETYVSADIEGYTVSTQIGSRVIGLATQDIASGTYGTIARRGDYLMPCLSGTKIGSVYAGNPLMAGSAGTVLPLGSSTVVPQPGAAVGAYMYPIGRAISTGGVAGEFVVVSLNL